MFISNLLRFAKKCTHEHVTPDKTSAYCPDCGKLIQNEWYITRCSCCGVKLKTVIKNGKIQPESHYCCNCGGSEYNIEKLEQINFIDIKFAALLKKEVNVTQIHSSTSCWQEKTPLKPKLLAQYL